MDSRILQYFVVRRTAVCVARVKLQSTTVFKIKEKNNPVYYSVPQAAVLGTVQGQK